MGPVEAMTSAVLSGTGLTADMVVVLSIIFLALVLFATERIPVDLTAILVMVLLMVLGPWTHISPEEGISGFANRATITVLAMLVLSAGVSKTGVVQQLGNWMAEFAGTNQFRQLAATIGVAGPASGFINNTPVVAILVPVVSDLAHKGKTSPSKLLIPLSFASMFGGMLTLIGTSTNILASAISARLIGHPFSMFEFTKLGVVVLIVGSLYLVTIGYRLLPERVEPREDLVEEYELQDYLTEVTVNEDSPLVGLTVEEGLEQADFDIDILQIDREGERFIEPLGQKEIQAEDVFKVRADRNTLESVMAADGLTLFEEEVTGAELEAATEGQSIVEVIIPSGSPLVGETLETSSFRERYAANVLAFRSHGDTVREHMDRITFRVGDTLLVQAPTDSIDRLSRTRDFIVGHEPESPDYRTEKVPHALLIIAGVVLLPALGVLPILVSALAGVVVMTMTGVLRTHEIYESVDWNVIFLLAGVIPLGIALEQTGAATILGNMVAGTAAYLPALGVLWIFYMATALITNVISNNASVVLMIPVAVEAAQQLGANALAFVLAVTFAASTAFMTPVGYQTNLFVYGPGNYRFTDFLRVGAPLQFLLSGVTVLGITFFWGIH
ncbi:MAG: SLC13 family permease [Halanaeroarchaeum sp.]